MNKLSVILIFEICSTRNFLLYTEIKELCLIFLLKHLCRYLLLMYVWYSGYYKIIVIFVDKYLEF